MLSSYERLTPLINSSAKPCKNLLCTNEKEYMSSIHLYATDILLAIKETPQLFQYIIRRLDTKMPPYSSLFLDRFAKDFVLLFFADFSSTERNVINILKHLEELLESALRNFVEGKEFSLYGGEDLMVNRIIKAFINSADNRDYLNLLFGKLFDEATNMSKYLSRLYKKRCLFAHKQEQYGDAVKAPEGAALIFAEHFGGSVPATSSDPNSKPIQVQINVDNLGAQTMEGDGVLLICDGILKRITGKLIYMPLPMRYFCKLLETIVVRLVFGWVKVEFAEVDAEESDNGDPVLQVVDAGDTEAVRERITEKLRLRNCIRKGANGSHQTTETDICR